MIELTADNALNDLERQIAEFTLKNGVRPTYLAIQRKHYELLMAVLPSRYFMLCEDLPVTHGQIEEFFVYQGVEVFPEKSKVPFRPNLDPPELELQ